MNETFGHERNFCERCGKRLGKNAWDVHTCSPPEAEKQYQSTADKSKLEKVKANGTLLQEPVAVARVDDLERGGRVRALAMGLSLDAPLYTSPPPNQWVGLTDDEVFEFADTNLYEGGKNYGILSFGKAIEAKLKQKNGFAEEKK